MGTTGTSGSPADAGNVGPSVAVYERLGGQEALDAIIDQFYLRVVSDPLLAPFFVTARMSRLRLMQRELLAAAFGGPIEYAGMTLHHAHEGRGIGATEFSRFVELFADTLLDRGVDRDTVSSVLDRLALYVDDIVGLPGDEG
jgi:hemoglobin